MRRIALVGNPNVGKSTLFNALTGLRQHTGNWPGKTVELAQGQYSYKGREYQVIDLPGTYSLFSHSPEEAVAEEFIREEEQACIVVLCDATCLERSLILALQVIETGKQVIIGVNLMDEALRAGISVDHRRLQSLLGIPVVALSAGRKEGLAQLLETVRQVSDGFLNAHRLTDKNYNSKMTPERIVIHAQEIAEQCVSHEKNTKKTLTQRLDKIFLHRFWGYAVMLLLLLGIFWLTIQGANYPSQALQWCFDRVGEMMWQGAEKIGMPLWLSGALLDGIYTTTGRIVAVMLPPMAIFFPLFTLLEDFGYLPRVAFLMDHAFHRAGACGKQSLTLCMGLGCNAAGVIGCRIIQSPRERLIAILTNAFVPCNGRFPALLFLIAFSFSGNNPFWGALALTACLVLCVIFTLLASKLLSRTALKGADSSFILEMPPYRRPRIGQVLLRSVLDRTLFVLARAVAVAAPAGLIIWCLANVTAEGVPILQIIARFLDAPACLMGLSGAVLLAFFLGSPANELVLPILMMILTAGNTYAAESSTAMGSVLEQSGWTWQMSLCTIVFFLFHWPCTTTLLTIKKETGSLKWTAFAALLPTAFGIVLCVLLAWILP